MLGYGRVSSRRVASSLVVLVVAGCQSDSAGEGSAASKSRGSDPSTRPSLGRRASQRCDAANASMIIDSVGIGPVVRSVRIASVASRCTVGDTAIVLSEGIPERAHVVAVGNHRIVALSTGTPDTSIIRVITTDAAFRTTGGVGVGSSVEALRLAHGRICAARGEGVFVVMAADLPGVSFAIDWSPPPSREPSAAETPFPGGDPGTALDAARITRLWVHGVAGGCRVGVG